jgi:hypothetical protein
VGHDKPLIVLNCGRPPGPTTDSRATRDFPSPFKKPPKGGLTRARLVSVEGVSELRRCFGAFISARKIPFPGNGDRGSQRPVRYQRLLGQSAGGKIHQPRFQVRVILRGGVSCPSNMGDATHWGAALESGHPLFAQARRRRRSTKVSVHCHSVQRIGRRPSPSRCATSRDGGVGRSCRSDCVRARPSRGRSASRPRGYRIAAAGSSNKTRRPPRAAWRIECPRAHHLAKVGVEGSNPFARSNNEIKHLDRLSPTSFSPRNLGRGRVGVEAISLKSFGPARRSTSDRIAGLSARRLG